MTTFLSTPESSCAHTSAPSPRTVVTLTPRQWKFSSSMNALSCGANVSETVGRATV
ncbi:hypothetical protein [Rhodococcus sp. USK13]|uniref:hypothetical protein n=1 Tax=Rhodococcus sp. USK13 TaxID=2806442 RepID=UPI001BCD3F83|nr:hypothetical protein [Rhodococcus sp. USK13]